MTNKLVLPEGSIVPVSNERIHIKDVSIYLQSRCNYECIYCDRDKLDHKNIGRMSTSDVEDIIKYVKQIDYDIMSFHGGEPMMNLRVLDHILTAVPEAPQIFIQTNGSFILSNEDFIKKYRRRLYISISYDFLFQKEYRKEFDIVATLNLLSKYNIDFKLQPVLPLNDPRCFSMDHLASIEKVVSQTKLDKLTLIPLQFIRRTWGFEYFLWDMDIPKMVDTFRKFIEHLYVMGMRNTVMGYSEDYNRHYFDFTKQVVLAPDGYLYPDYGFVENISVPSRLGVWRNNQVYVKNLLAEEQTSDKLCLSCSRRGKCGAQHVFNYNKVHYDFNPPVDRTKCKQFSTGMEVLMNHTFKLNSRKTLLDHIKR